MVDVDFTNKNTVVGRSPEDLLKYKGEGTAYIGKVVMSSGENPVLGRKVLMDMARPHVILVCGKRGGGKCLDGDTEIVLEDGTLKKIKEMEFESRNVQSLHHDMKIRTTAREGFYKRTVEKMLEIKLASGKKIKLTHEHPLLTIEGWKPVQELPIGTRIATPRIIPTFGNGFIRECEVKLLAYLLAEGHTMRKAVWFTNSDSKIVDDFSNSVTDFDKNLQTKESGKYDWRVVRQGYSNTISKAVRDEKGRLMKGTMIQPRNTLRSWLIRIGAYDKLAIHKAIPNAVFTLPKSKIALFLNRLFSCDGSIYFESTRWRISYATASPKMAEQIHHLLLRFGIISRVRDKTNRYEKDGKQFQSKEIIIEGEQAETFIRDIGFFGEKEEKQKHAMRYFETTIRNPNKDTIPIEIWNQYQPKSWTAIGKNMNYKYPKALRESQFYAPSRQKLLQIAKIDENKTIEMLASSDIYWDSITEITELKGSFDVYDFTVPECHNFIANDVIVHNSYTLGVLIEEFAHLSPELKKRISVIVIDMVGIFWTLKVPSNEKKELLEWGLTPEALDVQVLVPKGKLDFYREKQIPVDGALTLRAGELDITEWMALFRYTWHDAEAVLLGRAIENLKEKLGMRFGIEEVITAVELDAESDSITKQALKNRLEMAAQWGLLEKEGTKIKDIAVAGKITVIDVSAYRQAIGMEGTKDIIVGLIGKKLFEERMLYRKEEEMRLMKGLGRESSMPIVWMMIDEAHMFMPKDEPNIALNVLLEWVRVGRQPGLSLVLATQRPNKMHADAISQCDLFISHRMTAQDDIMAVSQLRPSYMHGDFDKLYAEMPRGKGYALLLDDNAESIYTIKTRPRLTWDGGVTANAFTK